MKERPILFSGEMVKAILADRKTQTRRVVKTQPPSPEYQLTTLMTSTAKDERRRVGMHSWAVVEGNSIVRDYGDYFSCPYGYPGDRLWVRETFGYYRPFMGDATDKVIYRADRDECGQYPVELDGERVFVNDREPWKPSIFMPRKASRITLEIVKVRVERLRDISEEDANAEGVTPSICPPWGHLAYRSGFCTLWDKINGKRASWGSNPWVWVVQFRRAQCD